MTTTAKDGAISYEMWAKALREVKATQPQTVGLTARQLREKFGVSEDKMGHMLRQLSDASRLRVHRIQVPNIAGVPTTTYAYEVLPEPKRAK